MMLKKILILIFITLSVQNCLLMISEKLINYIENMKNKTSIDINSNNEISLKELSEIGDLTKNLSSVISLNITNTIIFKIDALRICSIINNSNIKYLTLKRNRIDYFHDVLKVFKDGQILKKLTKFHLSHNSFKEERIIDFLTSLENSTVIELKLKHCKINDKTAKHLAKILKLTNIKKINLDQNYIQNDGAKELIKQFMQLKIDFSIRFNSFDYSIVAFIISEYKKTPQSILDLSDYNIYLPESIIIARELKHSKFKVLDISNNFLGNWGAIVIIGILKFTQIKSINISNNNIDDTGVEVIKQMLINIEDDYLEISDNYLFDIESSFVRDILNILEIKKLNVNFHQQFDPNVTPKILDNRLKNTNVSHLTLSGSIKLTNSSTYSLLIILKNMKINSLKICCDRINDDITAEVIFNLLPETNITFLNISSNSIKNIRVSFENVIKNTSLIYLDLSKNLLENKDDIEHIMKGLINSKIKTLDLSYNNFGVDGSLIIANYLKLTKINSLIISYCNIQDTGLKKIIDVLEQTEINVLDISYNNITIVGVNNLIEVLCRSKITTLKNQFGDLIVGNDVQKQIDKCLISNGNIKFDNNNNIGRRKVQLNEINLSDNNHNRSGSKHIAELVQHFNVTIT